MSFLRSWPTTCYVKKKKIRENVFFSIMVNDYTDISNKEQVLCLRFAKENLEIQEDFIDFYQLTYIKGQTIVNAIKDALHLFL